MSIQYKLFAFRSPLMLLPGCCVSSLSRCLDRVYYHIIIQIYIVLHALRALQVCFLWNFCTRSRSPAFAFRVEKVFILFLVSRFSIGIAVALSLFTLLKSGSISISKNDFPQKLWTRSTVKSAESAQIICETKFISLSAGLFDSSFFFCSSLHKRNLRSRKAIPFDWLLITFLRHVYFVVF